MKVRIFDEEIEDYRYISLKEFMTSDDMLFRNELFDFGILPIWVLIWLTVALNIKG